MALWCCKTLDAYFFFLAFFLGAFSSVAFFFFFLFAILRPPFNQKTVLNNRAISINPAFSQLHFSIKLNSPKTFKRQLHLG